MAPTDLILEAIIAAEYGESGYTWRNRRRRGEGPPYYRLPWAKRSATYYSRQECAEYYAQFRTVPPITAATLSREKKITPKSSAGPAYRRGVPRPT